MPFTPLFRRVLFALGTLALVVVALPAQGHTESQLTEWQENWQYRFEVAIEDRGAIPFRLMVERHDWFDRHPCSQVLGTYSATECNAGEIHLRSSVGTNVGTRVERWRSLVSAYFGPYTNEALRVIACESGGDPNAHNPSGASGLFQVMPFWQAKFGGSLFDPHNNVRIAKILFNDGDRQGWRWKHWVCQP